MENKKKLLIITNNSKVYDKYKNDVQIDFEDSENMMSVFIKTRDYIHRGHSLLTHPLSGSLKPNQTPYKTIIVIKDNKHDFTNIQLIENAIDIFEKCNKNFNIKKLAEKISEKIKDDFKTVDLSLIENSIEKSKCIFM